MYNFYKMKRNSNTLTITKQLSFVECGRFSIEQLNRCISFAKEVEQRDHRSGGNNKRSSKEIFFDTVEGKLGEFAVTNQFDNWNKNHSNKINYDKLDFNYYPRGKWDSSDLTININNRSKNVQIKTSKHYSQLLLLEQNDWDSNANYLHSKKLFDYIFLQRIKIDKKYENYIKNLYNNNLNNDLLEEIINNIYYDKFRYIKHAELQYIINHNFIIQKNEYLNKTRMDASNYYIQAYDMHTLEECEK